MWKRPENETSVEPVHSKLTTPYDAPHETSSESPTVGSKTSFKGDLNGEEDLKIEGKVEGKIDLKGHTITIGRTGWVKGNVHAKIINVEGALIGDAFAGEKVNVYKSGNVTGNITAPRVSLEDGAKLKGVIDMEPVAGSSTQVIPAAISAVEKAQESVSSLNKPNGTTKKPGEEVNKTTGAWSS